MTEEPGQPAGVQKDRSLSRTDVTARHGVDESAERPAGVSRVEEEALLFRRERDRCPGPVGQVLVSCADLGTVDAQRLGGGPVAVSHVGEQSRHRRPSVRNGTAVDPEHHLGSESGDEPGHRSARTDRHDDVADVGHLFPEFSGGVDVGRVVGIAVLIGCEPG